MKYTFLIQKDLRSKYEGRISIEASSEDEARDTFSLMSDDEIDAETEDWEPIINYNLYFSPTVITELIES
jgi:hypothetical protein